MAFEPTWRAAIIRVLAEAETPLHYSDITSRIFSSGYYATNGATPAATVNAQIASDLVSQGEKSVYIRVAPGTFTLREGATCVPSKPGVAADAATGFVDESVIEQVIGSYGMYWERDKVEWKTTPALLGVQQGASTTIDFSAQRGVYVLFDGHRPVYVGRAAQQPIGKRLSAHTRGRMAGRWDRFSWFGLAAPNNEGELRKVDVAINETTLIAALEAVLIEVMELPLNRKGGDKLQGLEYLQVEDPKLNQKLSAWKASVVEKLLAS